VSPDVWALSQGAVGCRRGFQRQGAGVVVVDVVRLPRLLLVVRPLLVIVSLLLVVARVGDMRTERLGRR